MKTYKINEIFESIQGEGSHTGRLCVFVRFAGCNMACDFCDTDFESYTEMTGWQILEKVKQFKSKIIVFTGGEPMLQLDNSLCILFEEEYRIHLETNGSIKIHLYLNHTTVSPKNPDNWKQKMGDDLKLLVSHKDNPLLDKIRYETGFDKYYLQPIDGPNYSANVDKCIELIREHPEWRLSLQVHKILKIQ